jgi:hypothetical protein
VFTYPWNIPSIPTCHAISCQFWWLRLRGKGE